MSQRKSRCTLRFLAAMTVTLGITMPSLAEPGAAAFIPPQHGGPRFMPPHPGGGLFGPMMRPLLFGRGLQLSEAQEDQIFSILHAAEPALRNGQNAARRARQSLDELVRSETYDAARARELADAQAKAFSDGALARAEAMYRVRQVLTPEQRATLDQRDRGPRGATPEQLERRPQKGAR